MSLEHLAEAREHGLRGDGADDGHHGHRAQAQGPAQRVRDPAAADRAHLRRHGPASGLGGEHPDAPSRCGSRPSPRGRHYARWGMSNQLREQALRPGRHHLAQGAVARARWSSRACCRWPTPWRRWTRARTRWCSPTTAAASSTARRCRSSCCPTSSPRSATGPRCTSTPASAPAATSRRRSALGARGVMVGRAYLYGLMVGGQRGVDAALGPARRRAARARCACWARPTVADLGPEHVPAAAHGDRALRPRRA